ncbi:hypothetical protein C2G38_2152082 [Gigaspora rosea]|uniref:CCHC-type domain-containing protein n=1 Tax=Gigaspora rosea TaxID=44941 RepID=A0A397W7F9_9GLOM|nr:hypothetical protein C2G38_2152082 [Gigaspora rosea]
MNNEQFQQFMELMTKSVNGDGTKVLLKENNLVKVKYFYGTDDKDPFEWLDDFEKVAKANNWTEERRVKIASGYLKEIAAEWYKENKEVIKYWNVKGENEEEQKKTVAAPKNLTEAIATTRRVEVGNYYGQHNVEVVKQVSLGSELSDLKKRIDEIALNYATLTGKIKNSKECPQNNYYHVPKKFEFECHKCREAEHRARYCMSEKTRQKRPKKRFELMLVAYELLFDKLAKHSKEYLIKTEAHWLRLNFTYDLQMEEIKIWNLVIEWRIVQNPEKDLWDNIPIKLMLPSRQVALIIFPLCTILTPKLSTRRTEPTSLIINEAHEAGIASWCQSCDSSRESSKYHLSSKKPEIDKCITNLQLKATAYEKVIEWIPYKQLSNIKEIDKREFGTVYLAIWLDDK